MGDGGRGSPLYDTFLLMSESGNATSESDYFQVSLLWAITNASPHTDGPWLMTAVDPKISTAKQDILKGGFAPFCHSG